MYLINYSWSLSESNDLDCRFNISVYQFSLVSQDHIGKSLVFIERMTSLLFLIISGKAFGIQSVIYT